MIFSAFLTVIFVFMAVYTLVFVQVRAIRVLLGLAYAAGVFFVWNPDASTRIAQVFGVGRGLDFFLILLCVAIVNALVLLARHMNAQHRALTRLARHLALQEARSNPDRLQ